MNELGQMALEFFRAHPNLMPHVSDSELVEHCRSLGAQLMAQRDVLRDDLFTRATDQARGPDGRAPSDGNVRAGMFRTATAEATTIVLTENLWSLLEDPGVSPRIGEEWDESLMDLEVPWHPDWREVLDPSMAPVERMTAEDMAAHGVTVQDTGNVVAGDDARQPLGSERLGDQHGVGGRAPGVGRGRGDSPVASRTPRTGGRRTKRGRSPPGVAVRCRLGRAGPRHDGRPGRDTDRCADPGNRGD